MPETVRLSQVAGVRAGARWRVLGILLLITSWLAAGRSPDLYPDRASAAYVVAGLVAGLLFLLSLPAHEVSHAVVARSNDVEVDGITLWMLGGVANLTDRARTAGAELRISALDPLSPSDISRGLQVMDLRGRRDVPDVALGAK